MARSAEYPDLRWVEPRSWTNANRASVQLIVIHTTEGSAHAGSAEDGAAYDARRTDGTSTHYFHDSDSTVQCVRTADVAHTARRQGNRRGIHHELCTRASASASKWADDYHTAMLRRAAKQAARDARRWGIPVRHLTVEQVRAGAQGFCGHHDITRAFPQDGGTHTDPGSNFPWSRFLDMVRAELNPPESKPVEPKKEWDEMASREEVVAAAAEGFRSVLWDAHYAAQKALNPTSAAAKVYDAASPDRQKAMRNARDTLTSAIRFANYGDFEEIDASLAGLAAPDDSAPGDS